MSEQQLIDRIARSAENAFGTGFRHGDLAIGYETYATIVEFTLREVGLVSVGQPPRRSGDRWPPTRASWEGRP